MKNKTRSRSRRQNVADPAYSGPVVMPRAALAQRTVVIRLTNTVVLSSIGTGVLSGVITSNPTSAGAWSAFSGQFETYRVLALRVHFMPHAHYWAAASPNTVAQSGPIVTTCRRDLQTVSTSYAQEFDFDAAQVQPGDKPQVRTVKMSGVDEAAFSPVSTGVALMVVGYYGEIAASVTWGTAFVDYTVEFKGRQ